MKHLLKLIDLNETELKNLLDLAADVKKRKKEYAHALDGKILGMIFTKSSTRTRVSFESGMVQLGGNALFLSSRDLQIGRGEPVQDTARVLSRYIDAIMIRTYAQSEVEDLAKFGSIPVINGLTDFAHPCQILADFQTIIEYKGGLDGIKICFVGDGNNVANSIIAGGALAKMEVSIACPKGYEPDQRVLSFAKDKGAKVTITDDVKAAAQNADVVYTDVWASMGQEGEAEKRKKIFEKFKVDESLMACAKKDAMVLHCLPAHREEEISAQTLEKHANEIFDEAENRLHAQKAVLLSVLGNE